MKENSAIVANQGYFGIMYLTLVGPGGNHVLGNVRSRDGVFYPPNLKEQCEKLVSKGTWINHLAQATLDLARKPAKTSLV